MKAIKKSLSLVVILILTLSLAACIGKETPSRVNAENSLVAQETSVRENGSAQNTTAANTKAKISETAKTDSEIKLDFTYSILDETYTEKVITIKFPQLIKTSDSTKADSVNKAIQESVLNKLDSLRNGAEDMGTFSLDLKYKKTGYTDKVLSISYQGTSSFEKAAYPVDVYYTQNIALNDVYTLPLKDIFTIDDFFIEQFKSGMYANPREDLDLEKSGVNLKETIESQYSNKELINLFQKEDTNYILTQYGVILSIEVPHVLGDHLEMAIPYESIEANMIKSSPVWKDYLFKKVK